MRRLKLGRSLLVAGAMLLAILVAMPYQADALEDKVVIVTSYPKDLTGPFRKRHRATRQISCGPRLRTRSKS
jgi:hypothetical protein